MAENCKKKNYYSKNRIKEIRAK